MSSKKHKKVPKSQTSYHESLNHCLYLPGIGHVAPDTYSGYGSLLNSDVEDDTEVTSAYNANENTFVPDSLIEDVPYFDEKPGKIVDDGTACVDRNSLFLEMERSGSYSPTSMRFHKFCDKFLQKKRKKDETASMAYINRNNVNEKKEVSGGSLNSVDLSPKSKKFKIFCDKYLEKGKNC
ncbi:uncharacterized protein LOC141626980 [Silene latifolia]|uniref:uncharacterized protein LOC141626980 n=1 Tax=Silene latifolia TaxID=37657 RepID=UPI003D772090